MTLGVWLRTYSIYLQKRIINKSNVDTLVSITTDAFNNGWPQSRKMLILVVDWKIMKMFTLSIIIIFVCY